MNAIILSVLIMLGLSLARVSIVFALLISAIVGGLYAGLSIEEVVTAFNDGLGGGASVALAYATLGAFAVALAKSGVTDYIAEKAVSFLHTSHTEEATSANQSIYLKAAIFVVLILVGFSAETIIPIHIAFIPILVPPLLLVMNQLKLDRRAVACAITFSITVTYMSLPVGFGSIFLNDILVGNINSAGANQASVVSVAPSMVVKAMAIPALGMIVGLLIAIFFSYRKGRRYTTVNVGNHEEKSTKRLKKWQIAMVIFSLLAALLTQLYTDSMIFGGLVGFAILTLTGITKWKEQDSVFLQGMQLMALVGFIMITASGFAAVMKATEQVPVLVEQSMHFIGDSKGLAAFIMLVVGLFITMGIGSSFSTVPIIATIYVPLANSFGFSPMAIIALVGTAAALGDAGSPASDSTLGPTAGLNADGQHDHVWDTVVPTFIHFNLPLLISGWIAAMVL